MGQIDLNGEINNELPLNGNLNDELNLNGIANEPLDLRGIFSDDLILKGNISQQILYLRGKDGHSPYINEEGNWMEYDDEAEAWVDTGVPASFRKFLSIEEAEQYLAIHSAQGEIFVIKNKSADWDIYLINKDNEIVSIEKNPYTSLKQIDEYFYEIDYDELDSDFANKYFKNKNFVLNAGCSVVVTDNFYGRNFDWVYNDSISFLVQTNHSSNRFATVGMTGAIEGLTKDFVETKKYSDMYKIVPFSIVDGKNEYGVISNINVVPTDYGVTTKSIPAIQEKEELCSSMVVRYIVDNFKTAKEAAEYIRDYVSIYSSSTLKEQSFEAHWLIADKTSRYILEIIEGHNKIIEVQKPIMTNFFIHNIRTNSDGSVYTPETQTSQFDAIKTNFITPFGSGLERFNILNKRYSSLTSVEEIKKVLKEIKYTNTYTLDNNIWYTEFVNEDRNLKVNSSVDSFKDVIEVAKTFYNNRNRDKDSYFYGTWQTTHSIIYDLFSNKFYISVQEKDEWVELESNFSFVDLTEYEKKKNKTTLILEDETNEKYPTTQAVINYTKPLFQKIEELEDNVLKVIKINNEKLEMDVTDNSVNIPIANAYELGVVKSNSENSLNGVLIDNNGLMSIKKLSFNSLVQDEEAELRGERIVLNGGNSTY